LEISLATETSVEVYDRDDRKINGVSGSFKNLLDRI
jgi:hypothetical protein